MLKGWLHCTWRIRYVTNPNVFARAILLAVLLVPVVSEAQVTGIWATNDGTKVLPTTPSEPLKVVRLFGMRNETLAMQVVVEAGMAGAQGVSLTTEGLSVATIRVFREDFTFVAERSHGLVWKPDSLAEPTGFDGLVPDRLIPQRADESVNISPGGRAVFWVDLWISSQAEAGSSSGGLIVQAAGGCERCEIAVAIDLLDLDMPDEKHAKSMVWFSGSDLGDARVAGRYFSDPDSASEADKVALRLRHYQLARQHHISLIGQHDQIDDELDMLLSGRAFTTAMGYEGPGRGLGLDVLALHAYGGELTKDEAELVLAKSKQYSDLRDVFVYVMDEPNTEQLAEVNRRVTVSRPMPSFVTTLYSSKIEADIFALPAGLYSRGNAAKGRAAGRRIWIYNGERPFTGSFAIDDVAVAPRVNPWIQYKIGVPRWFYWEATYYSDFQGKRGAIDVAQHALNFSNRHGDRVNGDGLLMYPGRDFLFPASNVGIDGPLASIRLKNWRRGIEDVEYLLMARDAGFDIEVDALLATLLPRVVDQVNASDAVSFPEDGHTWRDARRYLFELLRDGKSDIHIAPTAKRVSVSVPWRQISLGALLLLAFVGLAGWWLRG